jgi:hypothetical protein
MSLGAILWILCIGLFLLMQRVRVGLLETERVHSSREVTTSGSVDGEIDSRNKRTLQVEMLPTSADTQSCVPHLGSD